MNDIPEILYVTPAYGGDPAQAERDKARLQADAWACADMAHQGNHEAAKQILMDWALTLKGTGNDEARLLLCVKGHLFLKAADEMQLEGLTRTVVRKWALEVFRPAAWSLYERKNNWGAWALLACLRADIFLGLPLHDHALRLQRLMHEAVDEKGALWRERLRTDSALWYFYFFLAPAFEAARLLEARGYGGLLRLLLPPLFWFWSYVENPGAWPYRFENLSWLGKVWARVFHPCAAGGLELPQRKGWPADLYTVAGKHFGIKDWEEWGERWPCDPPWPASNVFRWGE
jgi:hypothetical protein